MLKHLPLFILTFVVFNTVRAQSTADTAITRLPKTDSVIKHARKVSGKTKRPLKKDSTLSKTDTTVKQIHKGTSKLKHLAKTDSIGIHSTKADTLHKGKAIVKHQHKKDSTTHLSVTDTALKKHSAPTDTVVKRSPVHTLTYAQYDAYTKGEDVYGFSQLAETNHYPMPGKVLKVAKQVGLTPLQTSKITELATTLERKKKEMGVFVIRNEGVLDSLFRTHKIDDGLLIFYANRSGLYYGELRNAILQACYATQKLLTPLQIKRFEAAQQPN